MSTYVTFNGDCVTYSGTEPQVELTFVNQPERIISGLANSLAFDELGNAWQVTWIEPDPDDGYDDGSRSILPCLLGPQPA